MSLGEFETQEYLRKEVVLLKELIGPLLHDVNTDEDFHKVADQFFEHRDNTVEDAKILARMLCLYLVSYTLNGEANCSYYHEVVTSYERLLADLN